MKERTTGRETHRGPKTAREQPGSRQKALCCQSKRPAFERQNGPNRS